MTKIEFMKDMTKCFGIAVLTLAAFIIGFMSPFAVIDAVTYLTGNMVIGALTGGAWGATLLCGSLLGWPNKLANYLKAKFKK
ncbi:hypothetical protein ASESINO_83 [Erwinia phage vB_EamM_Asesino]|uniref:Uncharacterized protein n=1 Tax=Erwinia phage vB_EamM_Asesino TaxID=1883370 RepID=A0A1B2IA33_9CAUD|nr:hypothetical protein ASESINO_83 [Erwinia phage vB_EamM_Asesino]ANZ48096.1 hypothetical protein ASESINO_83 [Erwinia phage vB_EamM_Asesino]